MLANLVVKTKKNQLTFQTTKLAIQIIHDISIHS